MIKRNYFGLRTASSNGVVYECASDMHCIGETMQSKMTAMPTADFKFKQENYEIFQKFVTKVCETQS